MSGPLPAAPPEEAATAAALLPPALRAQLRGVTLAARLPPPPGVLGQNASRARGAGLEFSQYRPYEPGDEPRQIDWKLYARSDRYFVREAESEAALTFWLLVDATASLAQADHDAPARSKLAAARTLGAAALEVATRQNDRFGLVVIDGQGVQLLPAARGARQRDRCLLALARLAPRGNWPHESAVRPLWARLEPASVVLMLGDGFEPAFEALAQRLAATRRDVRALLLTTVDERDFALRGGWAFQDPEGALRVEGDAAAMRDDFRARFAAMRAAQARRLHGAGVRSAEFVLDAPPLPALRHVLGAGGR